MFKKTDIIVQQQQQQQQSSSSRQNMRIQKSLLSNTNTTNDPKVQVQGQVQQRRGTKGILPWIVPTLVLVSTLYHGYVELVSIDTTQTLRNNSISSSNSNNNDTNSIIIESQIMTKDNIIKRRNRFVDSTNNSSSSNSNTDNTIMDTLFNMAPPDTSSSSNNTNNNNKAKYIHIVFSTSCKPSQDWQSYLFFFNVWKSNQIGNVTRIVSGCSTEIQQQQVQQQFTKQVLFGIPTGTTRFHIHFTPDYTRIHSNSIYATTDTSNNNNRRPYNFFNKPYAIRHWMEHVLGYNQQEQPIQQQEELDNTIIIIVDPDMFIMRPFTGDYTTSFRDIWHGEKEQQQQQQNNNWMLLSDKNDRYVTKGIPFGQKYELGALWLDAIQKNISTILQAAASTTTDNDNSDITIDPNVVLNWTNTEFERYYLVGPPYMGIASDMYNIVTVWSNIVVPTYYISNKGHLSEMYAYCIASALLQLRHQIATSFMVSNAETSTDEYWVSNTNNYLSGTYQSGVMDKKEYFMKWSNPTYYSSSDNNNVHLPHVFHYCQEYMLGPYNFFKYFLPENLLSCHVPLLLEPPSLLIIDPITNQLRSTSLTSSSSITTTSSNDRENCGQIAFKYTTGISTFRNRTYQYKLPNRIKREAFSICHLIYKLNDSLEYWKETNCPNDDRDNTGSTSTSTSSTTTTSTTYERIYVLPKLLNESLLETATTTATTRL